MRAIPVIRLMLLLAASACLSSGRLQACDDLCAVNAKLRGQVLDFTANHGADHRIWSNVLQQKRDMYVYVPPGYDPRLCYSLAIYLHGAGQDEQSFYKDMAPFFDRAIAEGRLPPLLIAAPDGSLRGKATLLYSASFWVNGRSGNFEDFLQQDVWGFLHQTFRIRPERQAHALIGASMGGTGAFGHAFKYRDRYKIVIGFLPAVNLRWVDAQGRYESKFDPSNWGWRGELRPMEVVGRPGRGIIAVRAGQLFRPIVGTGPDAIALLSTFNPIEIMDHTPLRDGELAMYVGYGGCDEFNIDTQVNSFLYRARQRGLTVTADYHPNVHHSTASGLALVPNALTWLAPLVPPPVLPRK